MAARLTIETGNVQIDETYVKTHMGVKPGDFVMVAVSDTGHGMDSATRQNIFEPFFTTKQQGKGTGLGLATVYGMVKQSGGDIWVYSEPGQGTTFKLYFPLVTEPVSPGASEESGISRQLSQRNRLLVEDETQVRELTAKMLKQLGYSVLTAEKGDAAIELSKAFTREISLLVTDVVMPNMSGRQVADALVAHPAGTQSALPVRLHRACGGKSWRLGLECEFSRQALQP